MEDRFVNVTISEIDKHDKIKYLNTLLMDEKVKSDKHQQMRLSDHWCDFLYSINFVIFNKLNTHIACHYSNSHYR